MSKSWSQDMKLDPCTFGKSKACEVLVDMMNQNIIPVREKHRVLAFIMDVSRVCKDMSQIKNKNLIAQMTSLYRQHLLNRIEMMAYSVKFKSYLKNVIFYIIRKNLE